MPELPEVETVRRSLLDTLLNKQITKVEIFKPRILALGDEQAFQGLCQKEIREIDRRGKYLIFNLTDDKVWVVHLRMTGKLLYHQAPKELQKHDHARFSFNDGSELVYNDTRAFGRFWLTEAGNIQQISGLNSLGLEPIDEAFSVEYWQNRIKRRPKAMVKAVLLDQTVVAGLGNIYADEVLFRAKIHPERQIHTLTEEENQRLADAMSDILRTAIANRGTTFRDYVDGNNERGGFQDFLQVFQKKGECCPNCGTTIERIKVAGRSSYFCPSCQTKQD